MDLAPQIDVALSVKKARGEITDYDAILVEMQSLPQALIDTKRSFETKADTLPRSLRARIITCSQPPEICGLHFRRDAMDPYPPRSCCRFFPWPLKLIEKGVSLFLLRGEDDSGV